MKLPTQIFPKNSNVQQHVRRILNDRIDYEGLMTVLLVSQNQAVNLQYGELDKKKRRVSNAFIMCSMMVD
jgi:hypothetical protein